MESRKNKETKVNSLPDSDKEALHLIIDRLEQLKEKGSVSRGWLGVLIQRVDRDLAESFGLDRATGALITQVLADSPAEKSGLKEGDIILNFEWINLYQG